MTKEEFYGNLKLLKAGEDDFEIATISNIKNSTTSIADFFYYCFKNHYLYIRRHRLTEKFNDH